MQVFIFFINYDCKRTPAEQIIPHEMLFFCKHCYNDQSVQVDALTKHPKVVTAHYIHLDECKKLAGALEGHKKKQHKVLNNSMQ